MSTYNKTVWQDGDIITADKMNNIENGIYSYNEDITNLSESVGDLKSHLEAFNPLLSTIMEQGSYSTVAVGSALRPVDNANIIRTPNFSVWSAGSTVSLKTGFQARLLLCDSNGGYITDASWGQKVTSTNSTATQVKVCVRKTNGTTMTPDEIIDAVDWSDIPLTVVNQKADQSEFEKVQSDVNTTIDNLYVYSEVNVTLTSGVYNTNNTVDNAGQHTTIPVVPGDAYSIVAFCNASSSYPMYLLRKDGALVLYENVLSGLCEQRRVVIPDGVNELIINTHQSYISVHKGTAVSAKPYSKWAGKKIVWFGTSIPESSSYCAVRGYPEYVGKLLGATVYNEAVGSSCARRGFKTAETSQDPCGWTGMGIAALWNMGSTIAEKNEILTNWESKWRERTGYDQTLTEAQRSKAIRCSYENKLVQKYIVENPVDLYVFDHGYNDWKVGDLEANPSDPYDMSTYQGAMNTYIKLILESNPRANILLVSHYEDQERAGLIEMQKEFAASWNLPFCELYKKLGWAKDRTVQSDGYWQLINGGSGVWRSSGGNTRTYTMKQLYMPDGRHPNTDEGGRACMDIGDVIADYINTLNPKN